jgi:hypothetical protein
MRGNFLSLPPPPAFNDGLKSMYNERVTFLLLISRINTEKGGRGEGAHWEALLPIFFLCATSDIASCANSFVRQCRGFAEILSAIKYYQLRIQIYHVKLRQLSYGFYAHSGCFNPNTLIRCCTLSIFKFSYIMWFPREPPNIA